ncbi:MAG: hypothetical protein ISR65_07590 [Bacteriovoracaceae bacterium]|nr:hypothetical protein [Bacteriovoracaceae bacterium]
MIFLKISLALLLSATIQAGTYEENLPQGTIELHRKYSGEVIFDMIKYAMINDNECNIKLKKSLPRGGTFTVLGGKDHYFSFTNDVQSGKWRSTSQYDCLLSKDLKRLECMRRLPGEATYQSWSDYIRMTFNLDEKGKIISMSGKKTREQRVMGYEVPFLEKVLAKFKCDIAHPAKITKPEVKDEEKRKGKKGAKDKTPPDTGEVLRKPTKIKTR